MGDALAAMLPYVPGLLISPLPVVAVILLLVSRDGFRKTTVFDIAWVAVSFPVVVLVAAAVRAAPPRISDEPPIWESVVLVLLGAVMLALSWVAGRAWRRQRQAGGVASVPGWMTALDQLPASRVAGLAAVLIIANPINVTMLLAAAVELGHQRLSIGQHLVPAAVFVLVGSLTVLLPYLVTRFARRATGLLPGVRHWLLVHNNLLTFWITVTFGLVFLIRGLRGLA